MWNGRIIKIRVLLNVVDKATGEVAPFTAWENMNSAFGTGITMNGTGANLNFFGSTGDGVSVIYPSSLEDGAVFNIAIGTEVNGNVFPEFTLYLVNGKWQATESAPDPVDPVTESVTITKIHNRYGDGWGQRLLIFLSIKAPRATIHFDKLFLLFFCYLYKDCNTFCIFEIIFFHFVLLPRQRRTIKGQAI